MDGRIENEFAKKKKPEENVLFLIVFVCVRVCAACILLLLLLLLCMENIRLGSENISTQSARATERDVCIFCLLLFVLSFTSEQNVNVNMQARRRAYKLSLIYFFFSNIKLLLVCSFFNIYLLIYSFSSSNWLPVNVFYPFKRC